jgi:exosortase/archaeosortase family protein
LKNTKDKAQHGSGKARQKSVIPAISEPGANPSNPKKPLFSKELLIKLLPLIKAFVLWFILVLIVHIPGIKDGFRNMFVGFTTTSTYLMSHLFFIPMKKISFSTLSLGGFNMEIIVECTAYNFYIFALALAIFANWSWKYKGINLLIFFGVIFLTNNLRFIAMGYIGRYYPDLFETAHDYVWNILFGFMIFGIWAWRDSKNNPDFQPKDLEP